MIMEDKSPQTQRFIRKIILPALIGGVVGFAAASGVLSVMDSKTIGTFDESAVIAALVGSLYLVIGAGVWVGALRPKVGAHFLNVEDADELREQKKVLTLSGAAMALWGVSLVALALAAPAGVLPQAAALTIGAGGLVLGGVISVSVYRACDELMRAINLEAGAVSYGLVMLIAGGWAMLAHLGYAGAPKPLDLLSLLYVLVLVASFIVIGKRGMLAPR